MNQDTLRMDTVGPPNSTAPGQPPQAPDPKGAGMSRGRIVAIVLLALALVLSAAGILSILLHEKGDAADQVVTAPVATETAAPTTTPDPAPAPDPVPAPPAEPDPAPAADPPAAEPEPEPEPAPMPTIHPLDGTLWDLQAVTDWAGGIIGADPTYPHQVEFQDGQVFSRGTVNGGSAQYSISGDEFDWGEDFMCGPFSTTLMLGPEAAMQQEGTVTAALESAAYYEIDANLLYILDGSRNTLLLLDIVPGG